MSPRPPAQRRHRDHDACSRDRRDPSGSGRRPPRAIRSLAVAATTRTFTWKARSSPTRRTSPESSTRSSRTCMAGDISPISSRNSVPPLAASNSPMREVTAPREGALLVAEQLALEQRVGQRAAVDRHERPRRRAAIAGECVRATSSLPVPLSPCTSTGLSLAATPRDDGQHLADLRALPHDVGQAVAPGDDLLERRVLATQRLLLGRLGHHLAQLGVLPRLGDEVVGAEPHRLHRRLHVGVAGEDDELGVDLGGAGPAEDVEAGVIGQLDVDEDDVELVAAEQRHRLGARSPPRRRVSRCRCRARRRGRPRTSASSSTTSTRMRSGMWRDDSTSSRLPFSGGPARMPRPSGLRIEGARQNNLKNISLEIPARSAHRHHRRLRLRQVVAGLRHAVRRGPVAVHRVALARTRGCSSIASTGPTSIGSRTSGPPSPSSRRTPCAPRAPRSAPPPRCTTTCGCSTPRSAACTARECGAGAASHSAGVHRRHAAGRARAARAR